MAEIEIKLKVIIMLKKMIHPLSKRLTMISVDFDILKQCDPVYEQMQCDITTVLQIKQEEILTEHETLKQSLHMISYKKKIQSEIFLSFFHLFSAFFLQCTSFYSMADNCSCETKYIQVGKSLCLSTVSSVATQGSWRQDSL